MAFFPLDFVLTNWMDRLEGLGPPLEPFIALPISKKSTEIHPRADDLWLVGFQEISRVHKIVENDKGSLCFSVFYFTVQNSLVMPCDFLAMFMRR